MPDLIDTIENGVARLTFNSRERMSAFYAPIREALLHWLPRLPCDPALLAIVPTGVSRACCAGGNVKKHG
jgi:2-(1,2-epoxy-1,2-dihydrophenyl)acetyl-CoA isomerase